METVYISIPGSGAMNVDDWRKMVPYDGKVCLIYPLNQECQKSIYALTSSVNEIAFVVPSRQKERRRRGTELDYLLSDGLHAINEKEIPDKISATFAGRVNSNLKNHVDLFKQCMYFMYVSTICHHCSFNRYQ